MTYANAYQRQIKNRNFLAPTGFKLVLNRSPKVAFFSNAANLPGITLGEAIQPTYLKDIPTPGDKIVFDEFILNVGVRCDFFDTIGLMLSDPEDPFIYDLPSEDENDDKKNKNKP